MNRQELDRELGQAGAVELLQSANLARLAYNGPDGLPRVIPVGFLVERRAHRHLHGDDGSQAPGALVASRGRGHDRRRQHSGREKVRAGARDRDRGDRRRGGVLVPRSREEDDGCRAGPDLRARRPLPVRPDGAHLDRAARVLFHDFGVGRVPTFISELAVDRQVVSVRPLTEGGRDVHGENSSHKDKPESRGRLRDRLHRRREARKQREAERARLARENPTPRTTPGKPRLGAVAPVAQQVRFCTAGDGVALAYAVHGSGPPIVRAANWLTHLDFDWESPVWRHWLDGSRRPHARPLRRARMRAVGYEGRRAVGRDLGRGPRNRRRGRRRRALRAAGHLAGRGDRGRLRGTASGAGQRPRPLRRLRARPQRRVASARASEAMAAAIRAGWTEANPAFRRVFSTLFFPHGASEQMAWYEELQRSSTSPRTPGGYTRRATRSTSSTRAAGYRADPRRPARAERACRSRRAGSWPR